MLAALIKSLDNRTNRCFWRINTKTEQLAGALGLKSETFLRDILIFCGYNNKEQDRFKADEFKQFCHTHIHSFRHRGYSKEWFIRLGQPTRDDPAGPGAQLACSTYDKRMDRRSTDAERPLKDELVSICIKSTDPLLSIVTPRRLCNNEENEDPMDVEAAGPEPSDVEVEEQEANEAAAPGRSSTSVKTPILNRLRVDKDKALVLETILRETMGLLTEDYCCSVEVECWNGKKKRIVSPPMSTSQQAFMKNAQRSRWVEGLLPTDMEIGWMLKWISKKHKNVFQAVARREVEIEISTRESAALVPYCRLNGRQFLDLRGFFRTRYNIMLNYDKKEVEQLQCCKGYFTEPDFGKVAYYRPKVGTEIVKFWMLPANKEIERCVDEHFDDWALDKKLIACLDYEYAGCRDPKGIPILLGGDHGIGLFRYHFQIHLVSAQVRKARKKVASGQRSPKSQ